jgi:hypothetical protein
MGEKPVSEVKRRVHRTVAPANVVAVPPTPNLIPVDTSSATSATPATNSAHTALLKQRTAETVAAQATTPASNARPVHQVRLDAATAPTVRVGPIGDHEATSGIWLHAYLRDSPYERSLVQTYGRRVGLVLRDQDVSKSDPSEFWLRDYAPMRVRLPDGKLRLVAALSPFEKRSGVFFGDGPRGASSPAEEQPGQHFHRSPHQPVISIGSAPGSWAEHHLLPLVLEQGNVRSVGGKLIVTDKVLSDNAKDWQGEHGLHHLGRQSGYRPRSRDEIVALLAEAYQVNEADVLIVPSMPAERTAHADMFLLPLDDHTVVIPEIRDEVFSVVGYAHEQELAKRLRAFLNDTAARMPEGIVVKRLPMMPGVFLEPAPRPEGYTALMATPTQSTLFCVDVDGVPTKHAFVPTQQYGFGDAYQLMADRYVDEACALFDEFGFSAKRYDAKDLLQKRGGGHCVSVPAV